MSPQRTVTKCPVKLIPTLTSPALAADTWEGERSRLTAEMLAKYQSEVKSPVYYVIGPPGMVNGAHDMLNKMGVDDDDIRAEDFGGY